MYKKIKKLLSKKVLLYLLAFTVFMLASSSVSNAAGLPFSDVKESNWFYEDLKLMYEANVINGFSDGTFKGQATITKNQILKLLVVTINPNRDYSKINESEGWFDPYLRAAREMGIEENYFEIKYDPILKQDVMFEDVNKRFNVELTRAEVANYVYKAYSLGKLVTNEENDNNIKDDEISKKLSDTYKDYSKIKDEYKKSIYILNKYGLMQGDKQGNFNPNGKITRAEVTAIIRRLRDARSELEKEERIDFECINGYLTTEQAQLEKTTSLDEVGYEQADGIYFREADLYSQLSPEYKKMADAARLALEKGELDGEDEMPLDEE